MDINVSKTVPLSSAQSLRPRVEGFIVLNHTNFGNPAAQVYTVGARRPSAASRP